MPAHRIAGVFLRFLPFWFFLVFFQFGGTLYFTFLGPFGQKIAPLFIVGIIIAGNSFLQVLFDIPAGFLLDRFGYRRLLALGVFPFICAAILLTLPLTFTIFLVSVLFSALGWLFSGPGIDAYILSHAARESAGTFIGLRDASRSIGAVFATVLFSLALSFSIPTVGFLVAGLLSIALVFITLSPRDIHSARTEKKIETHHWYIRRSYFRDMMHALRRLNPASTFLLAAIFTGAVFYSTVWFVVPLAIARSEAQSILGAGLSIFNFTIVLLGFLLGKLADKVPYKRLILVGLAVFAGVGMVIGFHLDWLFLLLGFLATMGDEMSSVALWRWLHTLDREHASDGAVAAVINLFNDIGWAVGPLIAGILYVPLGPGWTIFIGALFLLFTLLIYSETIYRLWPVRAAGSIPSKPHRARMR